MISAQGPKHTACIAGGHATRPSTPPVLLVMAGCTAATVDATGGKADSAVAALEGPPPRHLSGPHARARLSGPCDVDAECANGLVRIAQSVDRTGYCVYAWMRDDFTYDGQASIPSVAMSEPMAIGVWVYGQASVPQDLWADLDLEHTDPSSLWIGVQPPAGQEAVTLYDGATETGPVPERLRALGVYRDDAVNGRYQRLIQNVTAAAKVCSAASTCTSARAGIEREDGVER